MTTDPVELLMQCGAAKLTLLGLDDLYAVRTEQIIAFAQACEAQHEKELAALQARVRELEKCLSDAVQFDGQDVSGLDIIEAAEKLLANTGKHQQAAIFDLNDPRM